MVGTISKNINDGAHNGFYRFMTHIERKLHIYRARRKVAACICLFGGTFAGYMFSGMAKNMYTLGYMNGFYQPFDYSLHMMNTYGGNETNTYAVQIQTFIKEVGLDTLGEGFDTLDWLMLGQHFAKSQEEEIAFQAYYMAHLMDHERIRTNSQLRFDTNALGAGPAAKVVKLGAAAEQVTP